MYEEDFIFFLNCFYYGDRIYTIEIQLRCPRLCDGIAGVPVLLFCSFMHMLLVITLRLNPFLDK